MRRPAMRDEGDAVPTPPDGLDAGGRVGAWAAEPPGFVALDVDGTLLAGTPLPSERVLRAIRALVAAGVGVGVATGRMPAAVAPLLAAAGMPGPHVVHNGAAVIAADGTLLQAWTLSDAEVGRLLALGTDRDDLIVEIYAADSYRTHRRDPRSDVHSALLGVAPAGTIAAPSDLDGPAVKAVVLAFSDAAERDAAALAAGLGLASGAASAPTVPGVRFVNITHGSTDKGAGVMAAAAALGVDPAHVAAVGDEANDLPLLRAVGTAIAMGDAGADVRAAAHLVAPTFAAEGAAVALESLHRLVTAAAAR